MNTTPAATDRRPASLRYVPGLDGLRAISVLAVMVFHHYVVGGRELGPLPGGFLGVEVFFVVSGYLITSLLLAERRRDGRISLRGFWLRRARRLLPALFVLLAAVVAYTLLFLPDAIGTLRPDAVAALTYTSNWWQIVADRSYFVEAGRPALLKHLWSLAIEEQFYLFWPPLLILALRRIGRARTIATCFGVALASTVLLAVLARETVDGAYYATYSRLSGLLMGAVLAFGYAPYRIRGVPGRGVRPTLNAVGLAGMVLLYLSFRRFQYPESIADDLTVFRGGFLLVDIATLFVIVAAVHPASDLGRILGWRPLRELGLRSYSLYLWHYPIFCVTRPNLDFANFGHLDGWHVFALRMGLSLAAADLSYRYVERPIRSGALGRYRARLLAARGIRRRALVRRGATIAIALTSMAVLLGAGLANAQSQRDAIPGIDERAHGNDDGGELTQSALDALLGRTTTTTGPRTSTTRGNTQPTAATTTVAPALPAHTLAIGDSVMLGARRALEATITGIAVDAKVSRQFRDAVDVLHAYGDFGAIPAVVIFHLGTNGRITDGMFDDIMRALGNGRRAYFLTARVPRPWEAEVNGVLHAGDDRWPNAHVLEWRSFAGCHDGWFVRDGFHLTDDGQRAYATFVEQGLAGRAPTTCTS